MCSISSSEYPVISSPATITRPLSGFRKPMIIRRLTDLPAPLLPMIQTVCPALTEKLIPSSTFLESNWIWTSCSCKYGRGGCGPAPPKDGLKRISCSDRILTSADDDVSRASTPIHQKNRRLGTQLVDNAIVIRNRICGLVINLLYHVPSAQAGVSRRRVRIHIC